MRLSTELWWDSETVGVPWYSIFFHMAGGFLLPKIGFWRQPNFLCKKAVGNKRQENRGGLIKTEKESWPHHVKITSTVLRNLNASFNTTALCTLRKDVWRCRLEAITGSRYLQPLIRACGLEPGWFVIGCVCNTCLKIPAKTFFARLGLDSRSRKFPSFPPHFFPFFHKLRKLTPITPRPAAQKKCAAYICSKNCGRPTHDNVHHF